MRGQTSGLKRPGPCNDFSSRQAKLPMRHRRRPSSRCSPAPSEICRVLLLLQCLTYKQRAGTRALEQRRVSLVSLIAMAAFMLSFVHLRCRRMDGHAPMLPVSQCSVQFGWTRALPEPPSHPWGPNYSCTADGPKKCFDAPQQPKML